MITHKEIATKILDVIDLHKKSYIKTGISTDRAGNKHEERIHTKTITECFQEIFGDDSFLYEPYRIVLDVWPSKMESWAISVLKIT